MSLVESLPKGGLSPADLEALREHEKVERVETILSFDRRILSFTIQIGDKSYGLHSDHGTAEWSTIVSGDEFEKTVAAHKEWLDEDMDRVAEEL
jgi:hypothetical protein